MCINSHQGPYASLGLGSYGYPENDDGASNYVTPRVNVTYFTAVNTSAKTSNGLPSYTNGVFSFNNNNNNNNGFSAIRSTSKYHGFSPITQSQLLNKLTGATTNYPLVPVSNAANISYMSYYLLGPYYPLPPPPPLSSALPLPPYSTSHIISSSSITPPPPHTPCPPSPSPLSYYPPHTHPAHLHPHPCPTTPPHTHPAHLHPHPCPTTSYCLLGNTNRYQAAVVGALSFTNIGINGTNGQLR